MRFDDFFSLRRVVYTVAGSVGLAFSIGKNATFENSLAATTSGSVSLT